MTRKQEKQRDVLFDDKAVLWSKEAEVGLLGSVLVKGEILDDVVSLVRPEDFFGGFHGVVYRAMLDIHATGLVVDTPALVEKLQSQGDLQPNHRLDAGDIAYLAEILNSHYTTHNAVYYAKMIRKYARLRSLLVITAEAHQRLRDGDEADDVAVSLEQALLDSDSDGHEPATFQEAVFEALVEADKDTPILSTGFHGLDQLLCGLRAGQFVIIAARPGHGKTSFAANVILNMLADAVPVLLFSFEMTRTEMAQRFMASAGGIPLYDIRAKHRSTQANELIATEANRLSSQPLLIDDTTGRRVQDMENIARRAIRKQKIACIVVDYLGLIEPDQARQTRYEQVTAISRQLKKMARRLGVPVIVLAQLNREATNIKDHKPRVSHLRDSGAIEQDADIVLLLHRESEYDENADKGGAEVIVAKNRNGSTGTIELRWDGTYTRFSEPELYTPWTPAFWDGKQESLGESEDDIPEEF